MKKPIYVGLGALLVMLCHGGAQAIETGREAPNCSLSALAQAPAVDLQQFAGQVVYVDFWASWCEPCRKSFPFLNSLDHDLRDQGLRIVGVNVDEHAVDASAFLQKHPANFVIGADSKGLCPKAYGVIAMPSAYLIDRKGVVRVVHYGFRDADRAALRQTLEQLLNEGAPSAQTAAASEPATPHVH